METVAAQVAINFASSILSVVAWESLRTRVGPYWNHSFTWSQAQGWVSHLCERLRQENFVPDVIVGIGRGGAIVAGLVSAKYREPPGACQLIPISTVDRIYVGGDPYPIIVGFHALDVYHKSVLLLNADSYSGRTLLRASQILEFSEPKELRTGCLVRFSRDRKFPEFVGEDFSVSRSEWLLPWRQSGAKDDKVDSLSDEPTLVVLNGLVATGKTRVTDSLVAELGYYAIYSDWYWFRHGVRDRDTNPKVNVDHNTYMMYLCWSALAMGRGARVVLDTTSRWSSFRKDIQNQAAKYGVRVVFVHCHCDDEESKRRIQLRRPGGHDQFGTSHEYDRIKGDYEPLDDDELKQYNVIDVDTQKLECKIVNAAWYELEDEMKSIINAIKTRSFEQVKTF